MALFSKVPPTIARVLVLAAGALFAPSAAHAAIPVGNLILNPGAEDGPGSTDAFAINPPPSWTTAGELTAVQYGTGAFPSFALRDSIGGGVNFFAGGNTSSSAAFQTIDVSSAASEIDADDAYATLSGYLGGYEGHDDSATVIATYQDQDGTDNSQAVVFIGPVTREDRGGRTAMLLRSASGSIPPGTRTIQVTVFLNGFDGSYNDGYVDNLSLTLHKGKPPPPPPPPPTMGESGNAAPDRGTVRVRLPGSGGFISLEDAQQIPVGTIFDTTKGAVTLTTSASGSGGVQEKGTFSGGLFKFQQSKKNPLTTLSMTGGGLSGCKGKVPSGGAPKPGASAAAKRRRTLFSNVKGRFRTRGRNSSATVRGTVWRMTDTCKGTLTSVQKGSVVVRDFRLRKNKLVRAGATYLARAGLVKKKRRR
jgi:hypothetical protein